MKNTIPFGATHGDMRLEPGQREFHILVEADGSIRDWHWHAASTITPEQRLAVEQLEKEINKALFLIKWDSKK